MSEITISPKISTFAGYVAPVAATGPVRRILVDGTWAENDLIDLACFYKEIQYDLGNKHVTGMDPTFVMAYRNQIMFCAGDEFVFSGIDEPTGFENRYAGFGWIKMSGERGEALECVAAAPYAGKIALFARNNVQLWQANPDPNQWQLLQSLENTGTCAPKSVVSYGELDVFYLSLSGVRSLRARESTDLVNVQDVGTPIDYTIRQHIGAMTQADLEATTFGFYSIVQGRYWLFINGTIHVFSYYPGTKVSAWTQYKAWFYDAITNNARYNFVPRAIAARANRLFILDHGFSGTTRVLAEYSGSSGSYHEPVYLIFPFVDSAKPATMKYFKAIDIYGKGTWEVLVGDSVVSVTPTTAQLTASLTLSTANMARVPIGVHGTHLCLALNNAENAHAEIDTIIVHWDYEER